MKYLIAEDEQELQQSIKNYLSRDANVCETASEWEGEFKIKKMEYSSNFLEDGTWKETEHQIAEKDLTTPV